MLKINIMEEKMGEQLHNLCGKFTVEAMGKGMSVREFLPLWKSALAREIRINSLFDIAPDDIFNDLEKLKKFTQELADKDFYQ